MKSLLKKSLEQLFSLPRSGDSKLPIFEKPAFFSFSDFFRIWPDRIKNNGARRAGLVVTFAAGILCVAFVFQAVAACVEDATGAIICTGTDSAGVTTDDSNDTITVETDAIVSKTNQQTIATTADADAVTLDAGKGDNTVTNSGTVTATAGATAQPATGSASQATAGSTAVQTGDDADTILNVSTISSTATSSATSPNISLTLTGATNSYETTQSSATATGIDGGGGENQITNTNLLNGITATATSNSSAPVISLHVGDSARAHVNVIAQSESTGIRGEGSISNLGTINVTATSGANTGAARATVSDFATADVFTRAQADATGISGSTNNDAIVSGFVLSASSTATAEGSINLEGSATNVDIDASIRAEAATTGIDGNAGDDSITTSFIVTATSTAAAISDSSGSSFWAPGVTDATTNSTASTTGIAGGAGMDTVTNTGIITAGAQATTEVSNLLTSYGIEKAVSTEAKGGASSSATAFGIDGGADADTITNNGTMNTTATATTDSAGVLLTYFGLGMFSIPTTASAQSMGIEGGGGNDMIVNTGLLTSTSTATASTTGVSVSGLQYDVLTEGDSSVTAASTATGISGGVGDDTISNAGTVTVLANPTATATRVGVEAVGSSRLDADTEADATAVGIAGGNGDDHITNETGGLITVNANPTASSTGVDVRMIGLPTAAYEFFADKDLDSARTVTQAMATGVGGGAGDDTITNNGTIGVGTSADTDSHTWSVTITPPLNAPTGVAVLSALGTGISTLWTDRSGIQSDSSRRDALITAGTGAVATTVGIAGGDGADTITNNGSLTANATADAYTVGVTLSLGFGKGGVMSILPSVALVDGTTSAKTMATGIDGGTGDDHIYQNDTLNVTSNAYATNTGVGIDFKGSWGPGFAWGGTISDSSTTAASEATGILGGEGDDTITNSGAHGITVTSGADADSTTVSATVMWASQGVAGGITYVDDSTTAAATSVGIDGGLGVDTITNGAGLTVTSVAESTSGVVSVSAAGTETGVSLNASLADASLTATSSATGIAAGGGNDQISNTGTMSVSSTADVDSGSVSVGLGFAQTGITAGVAAADISVTANSTAFGIDGGSGDDTLTNSGSMTTSALSTVSAAGVSVQAGYAISGVAVGGALAKGDSVATTVATGMEGGTGDDTLTNSGVNTVSATSDVTAASVGVDLEGTSAGLAAGASAVDGNNTVYATATGLSGGAGNDTIHNYNQTTVSAVTDSTRTNVAVTGTFALEGIAAGAAFAYASNTATATATGIDGGDGDETIINNANLRTDATTTATTTSISIDVNISVEGVISAGASVAEASTTGNAYSAGIAGGAGNDTIQNQSSGVISGTATATAEVTGISVTIATVGFSSADVTTNADAGFTGIAGGAGNDTIHNYGTINIGSVSTATGESGTGTLLGYSSADVSITGTSTSIGMDGGDGDDTIANHNAVTVTSTATSTGVSVTVDLLGAGFANASTTANTYATGLAGGLGNDTIDNGGSITLTATSDVDQTGVAVVLGGYSDSDGSNTSQATITGMDGGAGNDTMTNYTGATITGTATAKGEVVNVPISLLGDANADGTTTATANAYGMAGGAGVDTMHNYGTVTITANATPDGTSGGATIGGYGEADVSITGTSTSIGMDGGDGDDTIANHNAVTVTSTATSTGVSVTVDLLGAGFANASTTANTYATGLAGGLGNDTIDNGGSITLTATSDVDQTGVAVVLGGYSDSDGSNTSQATITGMDGGAGNDTMTNYTGATITGTATAKGEVVNVPISLLGDANADGTTTATANAYGMAGGAGVDTMHNYGTVTITANATPDGTSGGATIGGYGEADVSITGTSTSIGMDGGDGDDTIANHNAVTVTSTATSTGVSVTVDLLGAGFANASTTANTYATGLAGGLGNDTIDNGGSITLTATSDVDQTGVAVVLGGYSDSDGSNTSQATITGMDGGAGNDTMTNYTGATITGTATAKGEVVNVPISLLGDANADGTTTATANAYGMAGGAGVDTMHNYGTVTITANATPDGTSGGATIGGYGEADVSITGTSTSIGMDGGDGDDTIANHNAVTVTSTATSTGVSVTVDLLGAGFANASTTANTYATGLAGGLGNDTIDNGGSITLTATSDVDQTGVAVVLGGYSDSDGSNTSQATITGMDGGAGNDTMTNYTGATITGTATAKGEVVNVPISLLGDANADGTTTATANAYGMAGGAGVDTMHNYGTVTITANATPDGTSGGATIGGYGEADVSITGTSTSIGMDGGDGDDTIANHNAVTVTSTATSTGVSVTVDLLGAGFANASTTANTYATGLAGGLGNDTIDNGGSITLTATSDVDQTGVAVVLGGYSDSDGSNTSQATITGMDGGAGNDTMTNYTGATITGTATAKGEVVNVPISLLGDANADGTTTATANAYGMAGGAGVDTMHNYGTVTITANATPDGTSGGATIGGYGEADVSITGTSTSIGMDGGDGDDTIANHNAVTVTSTATSTGVSVTVDLLGAGFANASTTANTYATGLAGGLGNDTIDNGGSITLTATSDVDQTGVAVVLGGYSDSDGSNTSQATITGMDGGAGNDTMTNYTGATITGTATAKGEVVNVPISLLGDANADGTTTATANAYGMAGGGGVDTMHNYGTVTITANATPDGLSVAGTLAGYGEADVSVTGTSTSVGMDGGNGDDTVANHNAINVKSTATAKGVSVAVEMFGGAGYADAGTTANTYATGLAGGLGNDTIDNGGSITLTATSKVTQIGVSVTLAGEASSNGTNAAQATLIGMNGGEGNDVLTNYSNGHVTIVDDQITLDPTASVYMSSTTVELAGDQRADGGATATAIAYGMNGGEGNDTVQNGGAITVNISSVIYGSATSAQLFGDGESNTSGTSNTTVVGMDGGEGDNTIRNFSTGIITLTATATGQAGGYTLELGGDGDATAGTNANAFAYGMRAGSGTDYLYNYGTISVTASSALTDSSSAYTLFGTSTASSNDTATSTAVGMEAGNGVNTVLNAGGAHLTVDATASASAENGTKTFGGTAEADANSSAISTAKGITGGTDGDVITNNGDMDVDAYAFAKAVTKSALFAGHAIANSTATMTATAVGIDAGDGQNSVTNNKSIATDATAEVSIYSKADTSFDKTISNAQSSSDVAAFGIRTNNGDSTITNGQSGTIVVHSYARSLSFTVDGEGEAVQHTTAISDEDANATAVFSSNATGIRSGDGNSTIMNLGTITVEAETTPDSHARASSTQYTATATAKSGGSATATGIGAGNGNNTITSNGPLTVTATNTGTALADYTSTHLDSAIAYAGAGDVSLTSSATGVSVGNGANTVEIRGNMTVTSTLTSNAHGHSNTDWADNRGDAYAGGTATATGISVGDAQNTIRNYGGMIVTATANVSAYGDGEDAATARANAQANAVGIITGNGDNTVINYGTIDASGTTSSQAVVSVGSDASSTESRSATGIQTGSGNDLVVNYGTIGTTENQKRFGEDTLISSTPGIAITTGDGNDTVVLGAGSVTTGTINLGAGDDTLMFLGTATINGSVLGDILPGTGSNSLVFDGTGTLGYDFSGFENTTKQGAGTFALASLPTMRSLSINQGTLHVNSSYSMAGNSSFRTYVNGNNGGAGLLSVNGTASLAGGLTVAKGPGYFYNGSIYNIITGSSITGVFSSVTLPQSTPLLSFTMLQTPTAVQVGSLTRSFATFASNPVEWAVADYLDRIQYTASNDLLAVLAEIQGLPQNRLGQAFSSLSPHTYDNSTRVSYVGSWQNTGSLQRRMSNVRSYGSSGGGSKPLLLAFAGSDAALDRFFTPGELSQTQKKSGLWLNGYQQWGDQQGTSGFTGYDYGLYGGTLGFDQTFSNNLTVGVSLGHSRTSVDLDDRFGEGDIKNTTGSLYGGYFTGNAYVEGAISYGKNKYSNYRNLTIGSINRRADSDHRGDVYSAYLGGGYLFNVNKWTIGPFGSLKYVYLNEGGFTETGADSLNLTIDRRKTDSLVSELGFRVARTIKTASGNLIPEITGALNYDFDIDDRVITASFAGSPDATFSTKGQKVERYGATAGVGLTFIHDKGFSTTLKYSGEFRNKYQSHGIMGQLRIQF